MYRLTILPTREESKLIDGGAYIVVSRDKKARIAQWQNGRGAFFTESPHRPGVWTEPISLLQASGWVRIDECKFDFVNPPRQKPVPPPPEPEPTLEPEPVVEDDDIEFESEDE